MITQLRLLVYLHTQLWSYASTHHQAPLQTLVQYHNHNNLEGAQQTAYLFYIVS